MISSSEDKTIRVWSVPTEKLEKLIEIHDGYITGISLHPLGDYLLSCSSDNHWAFSDINSGKVLLRASVPGLASLPFQNDLSSASAPAIPSIENDWMFENDYEFNLASAPVGFAPSASSMDGWKSASASASASSASVPLTCIKFHPDAEIFATGSTDSVIKIWDLQTKHNSANLVGHNMAIKALSFSENGYHLATAAGDTCMIWDLRKWEAIWNIKFNDVVLFHFQLVATKDLLTKILTV